MTSQLIIQNMYATEWYFADEARIYKNEFTWMVHAKRIGDDESFINWVIMPNNHSKTLHWIEGMSNVDSGGVLVLDTIDSIRLVTFSSSVGQKIEYEVRMRNGQTRKLYSWMSNFIDAWNEGFQRNEYPSGH